MSIFLQHIESKVLSYKDFKRECHDLARLISISSITLHLRSC